MAEARVELLTDQVTPTANHYVTGSAPPSRAWSQNMTGWSLQVDGEVNSPRSFTMADLQALPRVTRQYVLECASNWGRGMLPVYQQADWWSIGGVGCAQWTGVLLKDVLQSAGVKSSAVYVAWYGEDEGGPSRGVPIDAAMNDHTMLAWSMNEEPLPAFHGFPLRLLAPGKLHAVLLPLAR
jgi:DMSO/TMAO reductase YedYZ molybdopterin-dependent catalytic subunit